MYINIHVQAVPKEIIHCGSFYNVKWIGDFNALDTFQSYGLYVCIIIK
jgi:hypothetical protein